MGTIDWRAGHYGTPGAGGAANCRSYNSFRCKKYNKAGGQMADKAADRAKVFGVTVMLRLDTLEEIERLATKAGVVRRI